MILINALDQFLNNSSNFLVLLTLIFFYSWNYLKWTLFVYQTDFLFWIM